METQLADRPGSKQLDLIPLDENTPKLKVAKANALVEAQYELTHQEHKLLLIAMAQIRKDQTELYEQVFQVQDLVSHLELNPKNAYRDLRRISRGLMRKQVEIRNDDTGEWRLYQWVSKAYCEKGSFGIKFSDELAPFLLNLVGKYTLYELGRILRMSSNYAIRLYEILKQYQRFGNRTVSLEPALTTVHNWDNFPKIMGYNPESYSRFANLNQRVLKPAIEQVQRFTEFKKLEFKKIKINRRTVALEFAWKSVDTLEDLPDHPLYGDVRGLGVTDKVCRDIFANYDEDKIVRNLALTKKGHREKRIDNPAAYFVTAMKEDYANPQLPLASGQSPTVGNIPEAKTIDHPLYSQCASDQEFRILVEAERERGEPFVNYNEFHSYKIDKQIRKSEKA